MSISIEIVSVNDFLSGSIHLILSCHHLLHVSVINFTSSLMKAPNVI